MGELTMDRSVKAMEKIFTPDIHGNEKPLLPFSSYIYEWGRATNDYFFAYYRIPCSSGAVAKVNVVACNHVAYEVSTPCWEDWCDCDGTCTRSFQTDEDVILTLARIINQAKER